MNRKFLIGPLGIVAMSVGATNAQALIVGDPQQSNQQNAQTNQAINQTSGGGVVIGNTGQSGANASGTNLGNAQVAGGGGIIVGSPAQSSAQSSETNQGIDQKSNTVAGGVTITPGGGDTQTATNTSTTDLTSAQAVVGGPVLVGSPRQSNAQNARTNQAAIQASGGGVRLGNLVQAQSNASATALSNVQAIVVGGIIVGSPAQSSAQNAATNQAGAQNAGGGVVVGLTVQAGANAQATIANNIAIII